MAQSIFKGTNTCALDHEAPATTHENYHDVGIYYAGPSKALLRRALATFDLLGAAEDGRPLRAADIPNITLAELLAYAQGITGPTFQVDVKRLTRADYIAAQATWNEYKTGSAWTVGGGDVATPPATVSFTSPATPGEQAIENNLAAFVTDALANRGGLVLLVWRANNENPGTTAFYNANADPADTPHLRLRVTYTQLTPTPIDEPGAAHGIVYGGAAGRPASSAKPSRPARPARAPRAARTSHQSPITRRPAP